LTSELTRTSTNSWQAAAEIRPVSYRLAESMRECRFIRKSYPHLNKEPISSIWPSVQRNLTTTIYPSNHSLNNPFSGTLAPSPPPRSNKSMKTCRTKLATTPPSNRSPQTGRQKPTCSFCRRRCSAKPPTPSPLPNAASTNTAAPASRRNRGRGASTT
jgi:hypothetical protein